MSALFQDVLKEVNVTLLESIKLNFKKKAPEKLMKELLQYFYMAEWNKDSDYAICFKEFETFIFDDNLNNACNIKINLGAFYFVLEYIAKKRLYKTEVFLFIYPDKDIADIMYNICIDNINADELIYLNKVLLDDKVPVVFRSERFFRNNYNKQKLTISQISAKICEALIELSGFHKYKAKYYLKNPGGWTKHDRISCYYTDTYKELNKKRMVSVEIRDILGIQRDLTITEKFEKKYGKMLYGVLLGDEGYQHVPLSSAMNTLKDYFASRDFFRMYASNQCVLLMNLIYQDGQKEYENLQKQLGDFFVDPNTRFICSHPKYAGLEHGALLAMLRAAMLYVIIDSNMKKTHSNNKKGLRKYRMNDIHYIIKRRRKMVELVNMVMSISLSEIASMSNTIMRKLGIFNYVSKVRENLDMTEDEILIYYQKRTNFLMAVIAILGVFGFSEIINFFRNLIDLIIH